MFVDGFVYRATGHPGVVFAPLRVRCAHSRGHRRSVVFR